MLLHKLLRLIDPRLSLAGIPDVEVSGICEDSRRVCAGSLFVARAGTKTDGARFIADAAARGAVAVVTNQKVAGSPLPQIVLPDPAKAASVLANLFHRSPGSQMYVFGMTGTNGKTTSAYIVRHLLSKFGMRCGMIGTVEIDDGRNRREAEMTTPAACDIAEMLGTMRDRGCRAAVMETSSHALDQGRVAGVPFSGAAFTNLTGEHLDYHGTMEKYAAAKAQLFAQLDPEAVAVINDDSKYADRMIQDCPSRIIRFGTSKRADYRARDVEISSDGTRFQLITPDGKADVHMQLIGRHNIENVLAAAALVGEVCAMSVNQIALALRDATGAPGRLEPVRAGQPFSVLVDYAHTDDALENVLSALRPLTKGRLRVLFGCGGDRDRTKRPRMAKVAEKYADAIYVTSDNPRTERPQIIIDEILTGFGRAGKMLRVETDRRLAIEQALMDAEAGDVVLLAGKGHEKYQILGTEKHHFDDVEEATRVLNRKMTAAA
ncbi:MAG TPA: UDP-N-acetylmuramoyl-L-alanyl-D-glutamate--2,6-diaminopimelate ligase [Tepidisphaeraceae bacterium]